MMRKGKVFEEIRKIVAQIPRGKVATYGQVARLAGTSDTRVVGWAMWGNQDPKILCHRVIKTSGLLATNYSLGGWRKQKKRLKEEGINFIKENKINLEKHFWENR